MEWHTRWRDLSIKLPMRSTSLTCNSSLARNVRGQIYPATPLTIAKPSLPTTDTSNVDKCMRAVSKSPSHILSYFDTRLTIFGLGIPLLPRDQSRSIQTYRCLYRLLTRIRPTMNNNSDQGRYDCCSSNIQSSQSCIMSSPGWSQDEKMYLLSRRKSG